MQLTAMLAAMTKPISRRTMLIVFDVLHAVSLQNGRIRRDELTTWLHRATTGKPASHESQLRKLERLKVYLSRLGISYRTELPHLNEDGESVFIIERIAEAKQRVGQLLDASAKRKAA